MTEKFVPVVPNGDLWVNPDPKGPWARVAVCSRWANAEKVARVWGHRPAVVGPLRTVEGVDLLVRSLLANPQIRVVFVDGPDALSTNGATAAAEAFFRRGDVGALADEEDLRTLAALLVARLAVDQELEAEGPAAVTWTAVDRHDAVGLIDMVGRKPETNRFIVSMMLELSRDRPGGKHVLPPPPPKATTVAPAGDPGERVVADTIAEAWPQILARIVRFGRVVPTQYGDTKELLDLVSVIRDPAASLEAFDREGGAEHPLFEKTWAAVEQYHSFVTGREPPDGVDYTYGSRMHGTMGPADEVRLALIAGIEYMRPMRQGPGLGLQFLGQSLGGVDQFEEIEALLREKPGTRAAFMTPWRPEEDAGKESNRPCLVGAWFRVVDGRTDEEVRKVCDEQVGLLSRRRSLHLTVQFRSHDMWGGWPMNLEAFCRMLVETAGRLGLEVGHLVCLSMSAHLYDRTWERAERLADAWKPVGIQFDARSSWRIEQAPPLPVSENEEFRSPLDGRPYVYAAGRLTDVVAGTALSEISLDEVRKIRGDPPAVVRALAIEPGEHGSRVTAVFEGTSPAQLRSRIGRSGLLTSVDNALWLGEQISATFSRAER